MGGRAAYGAGWGPGSTAAGSGRPCGWMMREGDAGIGRIARPGLLQTPPLHLAKAPDGLAVFWLDAADRPVNTLRRQALADLDAALDRAAAEPGLSRLVLASAKDSFLAGADLHEFT